MSKCKILKIYDAELRRLERNENMNYMGKVAEILGVELGEEFYIDDVKYKLTKKGLMVWGYTIMAKMNWIETDGDTLQGILTGFYTIEWQPEYDEEYYYPTFSSSKGFTYAYWRGSESDKNIKKNVGIYKQPEQAEEKARELGWIE